MNYFLAQNEIEQKSTNDNKYNDLIEGLFRCAYVHAHIRTRRCPHVHQLWQ